MPEISYENLIYLQRPESRRRKMDTLQRAKQFAPFSALRGFESAVRRKELIFEEKKELSEEKKQELDKKFMLLSPGMFITAEFFSESINTPGKGRYLSVSGIVNHIGTDFIRIDETIIPVIDIFELTGASLDDTGIVY
ncbi:MAG: hypothetical protein ACOX71_00260 [Lachnospiraceae bacterium]|jgi:hypothetical protein